MNALYYGDILLRYVNGETVDLVDVAIVASEIQFEETSRP